jgi:MFS family permease
MLFSGAIVITVAKNTHYLLGGRFVLGFGVAITTTAAPAYVVEMSPPQVRLHFLRYFFISHIMQNETVAWTIDRTVCIIDFNLIYILLTCRN